MSSYGLLPVAIWSVLLFLRGRFWQASAHLPPKDLPELFPNSRVTVVIPARNEAEGIQSTVRSLLGSDLVPEQVVLVDDGSSDGTAELAKAAAAQTGYEDRLTVLAGEPLQAGWTGKLWAMQQGVNHALQTSPDFLLFTDADVFHAPDSLRTLLRLAGASRYDLVSFMVRLNCESLAETLLIPAFVYFFFMLYPPSWIRSSGRALAGAAGGCILIRTEAFTRAGGLEPIRSEIIDDCALARLVKRSGGRVWLGLTDSARSTRRYTSWAELRDMISRTAFNQLDHSTVMLLFTVAGLSLTFLLPVLLLFSRKRFRVIAGIAAYALMTASYAPIVRFYRKPAAWATTLPFAACFYLAATVHSAVQYWRGLGGQWKGRIQDGSRHTLTMKPASYNEGA